MADQSNKLLKRSDGKFAPGHRKVGGRKKGSLNKHTRSVRESALNAAEQLSPDGSITGFLAEAGREHKQSLVGLLGRTMPVAKDVSVDPETGAPMVYENNLEILAIPHGMCVIPDNLGGGYCCRELVRFLIAADRAGTLGPFRQFVPDAAGEAPLSVAVPYRVPQPGVIPFPVGHRRPDDDGMPPAA